MRKNLVALGLAGAIAFSGAMAVPLAALADEPTKALADGVPAPAAAADESGLTLPPNAAANDSLGDYTDPKNPVNVQLEYNLFGERAMAYINGVSYAFQSERKGPYWNATVTTAYSFDEQGAHTSVSHVPESSVTIPETINGYPVTGADVASLNTTCKSLSLGKNVTSFSGAPGSAALDSLTLALPEGKMPNVVENYIVYLSENGVLYIPEKLAPGDINGMRVYVNDVQVGGYGSDDVADVKPLIPYLRIGTPEASDALMVDDEGMFAYRVMDDGAEAHWCVYSNKNAGLFTFEDVEFPSHVGDIPVTSVGSNVLKNAKGVNWQGTLTIPDTVEEIKPEAFRMGFFDTVVLAGESSLRVIGDSAFGTVVQNGGPRNFGPEGSEGIVIPAGVESIGSSAFQNSGATSVTFQDGCAAVIAPDAFGGTPIDNNVSKVTVPPTVTVADGGSLADVFPLAGKGEDGQAKTFEVSFGDAGLEPVNVPFGANLAKVELPAAERAGYSFAGWTLADGEPLSDAPLVTDDVELSATWALAAPTVAVTADVDEPVEGETVTLTAKVEHPLLGGEADGLKVSYQWAKDGEPVDGATAGTLKVTEPGAYAVTVTLADAAQLTSEATSASVTVAFAAKPEPKPETFTVTFVLGNGDKDIECEVADGERVPRPGDPERDGYKFAGWFTTVGEDGKLSDEFDFGAPVTSDLTVYAGWLPADPDPQPEPEPEPGEKPDSGDEGKDDAGDNTGGTGKGDKLPTTGDPAALAGLVAAAGIAAAACGTIRRKR